MLQRPKRPKKPVLPAAGLLISGEMQAIAEITVIAAQEIWPTPGFSDGKGGWAGQRTVERAEALLRGERHRSNGGHCTQITLPIKILAEELREGTDRQATLAARPNPRFVEWLMGYPKDWTKL